MSLAADAGRVHPTSYLCWSNLFKVAPATGKERNPSFAPIWNEAARQGDALLVGLTLPPLFS
jgi:hypothetical protein